MENSASSSGIRTVVNSNRHEKYSSRIDYLMIGKHEEPEEVLTPRKVYDIKDHPVPEGPAPFVSTWHSGTPIAIDLGRQTVRVGMANKSSPTSVFPSQTAKCKDKKLSKSLNLSGWDAFLPSSVKSSMKTPFDGDMITNWDSIEILLDYTFLHLGVESQNKVSNPVVMSETLVPPFQQRFNMVQMLFETYNVPKLAFGVDSVFSFYQNGGHSGLVVGTGHNATHVIPVVRGQPVVPVSKRIDWGGEQATNYLASYLTLKYPYFPNKVTNFQVENMIHDHCYVSTDYQKELANYLDLDQLEKKDIVLESPFTEIIKTEKTEEELAAETEKRRENIKKMQQQARERRLEKLVQKEKDFKYFSDMREKMKTMNKKQVIATLREAEFDDEDDLNTYLTGLEKNLKKARSQDVGENDDGDEKTSFEYLEVPDEQLDEEQLKEKRKQRLMKANFDARQRAKQEKEAAQKEAEEAARKDKEWRESDLESWCQERRARLDGLKKHRKKRLRLKEELNDRKSRASQMRMKNIASLASDDTKGSNGRRKRATNATIDNDPNDTFGANDDDWAIYRDIAGEDDGEEEEELDRKIFEIEAELLEYDPTFTIEDTLQRQYNWRNSILHRHLRGPRDFEPEDQHQQHQIHLNVERIRVPEILFQPSIAGIDQCGLSELCEQTVLRRLPQEQGFSGDDSEEILRDVFLTGGQALFKGFEERMRGEFQSFLPVGADFHVRTAKDPLLDSWRGMAKWSTTEDAKKSYVSKKQYEEMGPDYIKENRMGCIKL